MGETVTFGNGLSERIRGALACVLHDVIPAMFKAQEPWAIMGSTASVLQGLDGYSPPDVDLVTTMKGAYIMEGAVCHCGVTLRPVGYSVREPYESHFGIFEVGDVKVEVMGDLIIRCPDGMINAGDHFSRWSDDVRVLHFEGMHVPVVPLEWQLVANVLLRRPERSGPIAEFLLRRGYNNDYVARLLADDQNGQRSITEVRRLLHLDA
jgi:Aminoglycoside-2''-adenylyltransferase